MPRLKMILPIIVLSLILETAAPAHGQNDGLLFFESENDLYGDAKDRWFTNGFRLGYRFGDGDGGPVGSLLKLLLPGEETPARTDVYLALGQAMFSPADITVRDPIPGDRRFAGWLYGEAGIRSGGERIAQTLSLSLGVTGDPSLARRTQKFVHQITNSPDPKGWPNQLRFEPTMQGFYTIERPIALTDSASPIALHLTPSMGIGVGTVRIDAGGGVLLSLGSERPRFVPRSIGPGAGGAVLRRIGTNGAGWYVYGGFDARAVAHDFFLDGGTFRSGPDLDKRGVVYEAKAGFAVGFQNVLLAYSFIHRSREFVLQPDGQDYGAITLSIGF